MARWTPKPMPGNGSHAEKGFTLVELLVVIAAMALLLAILMPSLTSARHRAKSVVCRGNLKQWGVILSAYTGDNNGHFFRGMMDGQWNDWIEILEPFYGKVGGLTCCPLATKTRREGGQGVFTAWEDPEGDYGSYGLSAWVCSADPGAVFGDALYWRDSTVRGTSNIPVFLDCLGIAGWPDHSSLPPGNDGQLPQGVTLQEQMKNFCVNRHGNGTTNCLFMDWSVRPVGLKELWKLKWHRSFDTSGPWTQGHAPPPAWPDWMRDFRDY